MKTTVRIYSTDTGRTKRPRITKGTATRSLKNELNALSAIEKLSMKMNLIDRGIIVKHIKF